jgi:hypothetical protein
MILPEDTFPPEERKDPSGQKSDAENAEFPAEPILPEDFTPLVRPGNMSSSSPARRRRARRTLIPPGDSERAALTEDLARRAFPSFEFYVLAIVCGILLGAGYLLDSDALLLLGVLLAPLLTPWVGMVLSTITGGLRFFLQTLASLFVAVLLAFCSSSLIGLFNRLFDLTKFYRVTDHAKLWWPDLLVVAGGAVLLVLAFVRGERRPTLPSIMVAYGLFMPAAAAGFGLGAGLPNIWPNGIYILLTHLALATLAGGITLAALRFRPQKTAGYILPVLLGLLCIAGLAVFTGLAGWIVNRVEPLRSEFTPSPLVLVSPTPGLPPSATPGLPTRTFTLLPSEEPSATVTDTPAPAYAIIAADSGGGANVRTEPGGGNLVITLINGTVVEVLPEIEVVGTIPWVHIRSVEGLEGWVLQSVLVAAPESAAFSTITPTP